MTREEFEQYMTNEMLDYVQSKFLDYARGEIEKSFTAGDPLITAKATVKRLREEIHALGTALADDPRKKNPLDDINPPRIPTKHGLHSTKRRD